MPLKELALPRQVLPFTDKDRHSFILNKLIRVIQLKLISLNLFGIAQELKYIWKSAGKQLDAQNIFLAINKTKESYLHRFVNLIHNLVFNLRQFCNNMSWFDFSGLLRKLVLASIQCDK